jgi:hypothetical protein
MKLLPEKTTSFVESLKGKKPLAIAIAVVIFAIGAWAINKGYITEGLFNQIIDQVDSATVTKVVDTTKTVVIDSIPQ